MFGKKTVMSKRRKFSGEFKREAVTLKGDQQGEGPDGVKNRHSYKRRPCGL